MPSPAHFQVGLSFFFGPPRSRMKTPTKIGRRPWIGQPVRRLEDDRLLRGQGCFTDDFLVSGQAHAWFVRSPHPHARIRAISTGAARAAPGVIAVLTGADAVADG